jgi:hypothetical protein
MSATDTKRGPGVGVAIQELAGGRPVIGIDDVHFADSIRHGGRRS